MNRLCTDFLVPASSMVLGAASAFNLSGNFYRYNLSSSPSAADARALSADFSMVGQDIQDALIIAKITEKLQQLELPLHG